MPYSKDARDKLPEHIQKLDEKKQDQWIGVWNSTFENCESEDKAECEKNAFIAANGVVSEKRGLLEWFMDVVNRVVKKERTLSYQNLYEQVSQIVMGDPNQPMVAGASYPWLNDLYHRDDGTTFAVVSEAGKLFTREVIVNGSSVTVGGSIPVTVEYIPTTRSVLKITRDKSGNFRWFILPAATSVLNRVGEIDSTKLFDRFVEQVKGGNKPELRFYHLHGKEFALGRCDWLAREGWCLLASGTFYDTEFARRAAASLAKDDKDFWGASIGYMPVGLPEILRMGEAEIRVYNNGIQEEISILPETEAASWFTRSLSNIQEVSIMNDNVKKALRELAGDDEFVKELEGKIDGINRSIEADGLIKRETEKVETETPPVPETPADKPVDEKAKEDLHVAFEVSQDYLRQIVREAVTEVIAASEKEDEKEPKPEYASASDMAALVKQVADLSEKLSRVTTDVATSEEERKLAYQRDLPSKTSLVITHRAKAQAPVDEKVSFAAKAEDTLANLK